MLPVIRHILPIAVAAALVVAGPVVATAQAQPARPEMRDRSMASRDPVSRDSRSLSDAVRRVQRETGGRILGAERVPYDGRAINRVKYMDDRGRVRYMDDPSPTAQRRPRTAEPSPRGDNP